uniref:GrpE protein homolog n=1 Tax=Attheya septentrionalis TaxID=420275 RepID=A0A7S2UMH7_9STRA|mmetsp:Transcript_4836/g.8492  ORF Transcript_4836/g.8492 Transcript_4836/m.8492 type:complete len:270 (+) Transcript_4836:172-981(+)|eukprot:CAMPEP_0198296010 /NCGR_PEP_ID=MMETSP1449-20131203/30508_1 /TAXON_ID=420275 /ORGANISM="Attheya septentrionalis, Strain CCMP2084" /LENGTH=269 /DNA_ID=CAMNT_0043996477 /DNA_START=172 /DNA_END=981 /DNA_ORIENTATION=+
MISTGSKFVRQVGRSLLRTGPNSQSVCSSRRVTVREFNRFAATGQGYNGFTEFPSRSASRLSEPRSLSSTAEGEKSSQDTEKAPEEVLETESPEEGGTDTDEEASVKEEPVSRESELEKQLKETKDHLLRELAEQENIRRIAKRDVASARSFAISSFAKSLLDTSDNLSRAMEAVPEEFRADSEDHPVLSNLFEGIKMTDENLTRALAKNGLEKFGKSGEKFDPNMHDALFEYPDPNSEAGTIGQVMKVGFMLNNRVIRPAEVGVVKKA